MANSFTIEVRENYIYVRILAEQASIELSEQIIQIVTQTCDEHNCYNVLGESFSTKPMSNSHMAKHKHIFAELDTAKRPRIAWVNHDKSVAESAKFGLMLLKKNGLVEGFQFKTVREALDWLLNEKPDA